jgi:hypothetical protein
LAVRWTRRRIAKAVPLVLLLLTSTGCIPVSRSSVSSTGGEAEGARLDQAPHTDRVRALSAEFRLLGDVSPADADTLAAVAVDYSRQLADWCDMAPPVEWHNVMVNLGLRQRGLCYEVADYLQAELRSLDLQSFDFHRIVAWRDNLWNEHNAVVVTARGRPWDSGVVLDAWRNAGALRWSPVKLDHYPWQPKHPPPAMASIESPEP